MKSCVSVMSCVDNYEATDATQLFRKCRSDGYKGEKKERRQALLTAAKDQMISFQTSIR